MPLDPTQTYQLEKSVWTEADFDRMSWHDIDIHAFTFLSDSNELLLDIDYLFAWVLPAPPRTMYSFWGSPATLVFREVRDANLEFIDASYGLTILGVGRVEAPVLEEAGSSPLTPRWAWTLRLVESSFSFTSSGFTQYARRAPAHLEQVQSFSLEERGGISFDRPAAL